MKSKKSIEDDLEAIRRRFGQLNPNERGEFRRHLASLARWHAEPMDYPILNNIDFPERLTVAHAVCHPECGAKEFIVEGSTQECQYCGGLMFRTKNAEYRRTRATSGQRPKKKGKGRPNQAL